MHLPMQESTLQRLRDVERQLAARNTQITALTQQLGEIPIFLCTAPCLL